MAKTEIKKPQPKIKKPKRTPKVPNIWFGIDDTLTVDFIDPDDTRNMKTAAEIAEEFDYVLVLSRKDAITLRDNLTTMSLFM